MGKPFSKFSGQNHFKFFSFLLYYPKCSKLFQFILSSTDVLSLNTAGIGGHSDSNKRRKLFNYLKNIALLKQLCFFKKRTVPKR